MSRTAGQPRRPNNAGEPTTRPQPPTEHLVAAHYLRSVVPPHAHAPYRRHEESTATSNRRPGDALVGWDQGAGRSESKMASGVRPSPLRPISTKSGRECRGRYTSAVSKPGQFVAA